MFTRIPGLWFPLSSEFQKTHGPSLSSKTLNALGKNKHPNSSNPERYPAPRRENFTTKIFSNRLFPVSSCKPNQIKQFAKGQKEKDLPAESELITTEILNECLHLITSNDAHIDEKTNESGSSLDASLIDLDNSEVTDDYGDPPPDHKEATVSSELSSTTPQSLN